MSPRRPKVARKVAKSGRIILQRALRDLRKTVGKEAIWVSTLTGERFLRVHNHKVKCLLIRLRDNAAGTTSLCPEGLRFTQWPSGESDITPFPWHANPK